VRHSCWMRSPVDLQQHSLLVCKLDAVHKRRRDRLPATSAPVAAFFAFLYFRCLRFVRRRWAGEGELSACSRLVSLRQGGGGGGGGGGGSPRGT
jgi:hypothetical protein